MDKKLIVILVCSGAVVLVLACCLLFGGLPVAIRVNSQPVGPSEIYLHGEAYGDAGRHYQEVLQSQQFTTNALVAPPLAAYALAKNTNAVLELLKKGANLEDSEAWLLQLGKVDAVEFLRDSAALLSFSNEMNSASRP